MTSEFQNRDNKPKIYINRQRARGEMTTGRSEREFWCRAKARMKNRVDAELGA